MSILTEVNEIEGKVVDTVRSIQKPVVDYVRKGVDLAEGVLPKLPYPQGLPKPADVVSSQFEFAKALLDAQRDFVSEIIDAVAPLVTTPTEDPVDPVDAVVTERVTETPSEQAAEGPAPKTAAKPAAKRTATRKTPARKTTRTPKAST